MLSRSSASACWHKRLWPTRCFTVLAVESSADDTCAAVVTSSRDILSNVVIKQNDLHEGYGGIHPMVAIQAHQRNMPIAVKRALREANLDIRKDIDGIAFTRGPGIGGCLSVGSNAAKTLAAALNLPIVGVHHMQAHALTPLLTSWPNPPKFPFLTLLVSGGHTLLLLAKSLNSFQILATTPDESIGRSFDKVSRMLGLGWTSLGPGAALEQFCAQPIEANSLELPPYPRPLRGRLAFSYSSLHSYVERYITAQGGLDNIDTSTRLALARGFQTAAVAQLEEKLLLAFNWCSENNIQVRDVVVSGGVASNTYLRERLAICLSKVGNSTTPISLCFPPPALCTDNAVMIAWASMHRFLAQDYDKYTIDLLAKWNIDNLSP
ncbi:Gcp-like domain-containing protein [Lyophyllum atratum]|nr:Gcp-like domain-containing protein [Lyophyllum atratum]